MHLLKTFKSDKKKEKKNSKIVSLAIIKLNSIKSMTSKALVDNETNHEEFTVITKREKKYCELKESTRIMKGERSDVDRNKLIEDGKKWVLMKLLNQKN